MIIEVSKQEFDAVLAGLRLLQWAIKNGVVVPCESTYEMGSISEILTNDGDHPGLSVDEIDALCERIN